MRCGYELIPVRENCSEIGGVNDAVEIDIAAGLGGGSPCTEHAGQITRANMSIAIDIGSTQDQARFEQRKIERIDAARRPGGATEAFMALRRPELARINAARAKFTDAAGWRQKYKRPDCPAGAPMPRDWPPSTHCPSLRCESSYQHSL